MLVDPAHAGSVTAVEEVPEYGLPGHNAVKYTLNINAPMQRVMKLRKLPPFGLPPRDDTDLEEICREFLRPHIPQWDSVLDTGASVDRLWEFWTWLAEQTGLALSCDGLTPPPLSECLFFSCLFFTATFNTSGIMHHKWTLGLCPTH